MDNQIFKATSVLTIFLTAIGFLIQDGIQHKNIMEAQSQNQYMYHKNEVIKEAIAIYQIATYDGLITEEEYTDLYDHAFKIAVWSDLKVYRAYILFLDFLFPGTLLEPLSKINFLNFLKFSRLSFSNYNEDEIDSLNEHLMDVERDIWDHDKYYKKKNKLDNSVKKILKEIKIDSEQK